MGREALAEWVRRYERAWREPGTDEAADLFAPGATYSMGPYEPTHHGLDAIRELWEAERDGPGEVFAMGSEIVACEGAVGVVRVGVDYGDPVVQSYRDLWIVELDDEGRCRRFEEWPFWPAEGGAFEA